MRTPARIYDLRSTFASNALAAGVSVFELARIMGTSGAMIERAYGTLIEGAGADIARRLGAFEERLVAMKWRRKTADKSGRDARITHDHAGYAKRPDQDSNLGPTP